MGHEQKKVEKPCARPTHLPPQMSVGHRQNAIKANFTDPMLLAQHVLGRAQHA